MESSFRNGWSNQAETALGAGVVQQGGYQTPTSIPLNLTRWSRSMSSSTCPIRAIFSRL